MHASSPTGERRNQRRETPRPCNNEVFWTHTILSYPTGCNLSERSCNQPSSRRQQWHVCKAVSTRSSSTLARNRYGFHTEKKSCASTVARPCLLADTWLSELNTPRNLTPRASIYNGLTTVSCKRLRNHCRTRDENSWLPSHPTHTNSHISSCPINPTRRTIML